MATQILHSHARSTLWHSHLLRQRTDHAGKLYALLSRATLDLAGASVSIRRIRVRSACVWLNVVTGGTVKIHKLILAGEDLKTCRLDGRVSTVGVTVTFEARMVRLPGAVSRMPKRFLQPEIHLCTTEVASGQPSSSTSAVTGACPQEIAHNASL